MSLLHLKSQIWLIKCLLFSFTLLVCQDVATLHAQESSQTILKIGIQAYNEADFEKAVNLLQKALNTGLKQETEMAKCHEYLAYAYAAMGEDIKSKKNYIELIKLNPNFTMAVTVSPKLKAIFNVAKKDFDKMDFDSPEIVFSPPSEVAENQVLELVATITDNSGSVIADLFYKNKSNTSFIKTTMKLQSNNQYEVIIPAEAILEPSLSVYIQAIDSNNNPPTFAGSKEKPFQVKVTKPSQIVNKSHQQVRTKLIIQAPQTVEEKTPILIQCDIKDGSANDATMFARVKGSNQYYTFKMSEVASNIFSVQLGSGAIQPPAIEYYVEAYDATNNVLAEYGNRNSPIVIEVKAKEIVSVVKVPKDEIAPEIQHKAIKHANEGEAVTIEADITDNGRVKTAVLRFRNNDDGQYQSVVMKLSAKNKYSARIPSGSVLPPQIQYYIFAVDTAGNESNWKKDKPLQLDVKCEPVMQSHQMVAQEGNFNQDQIEISKIKKGGSKKWLWIAGGAILIGGVAVGLGRSSGDTESTTGSISVRVPE